MRCGHIAGGTRSQQWALQPRWGSQAGRAGGEGWKETVGDLADCLWRGGCVQPHRWVDARVQEEGDACTGHSSAGGLVEDSWCRQGSVRGAGDEVSWWLYHGILVSW